MLSNQPATRLTPAVVQSPYVGPRPFTTKDREIFFGRNQEALELTSLIKAHPEVLLYAQSGAGKTSLLFAQVIPVLDTEEDFDVLPPARVRTQESFQIPDEKISNIYMFNALKNLSDDQLSVIERAQFSLADYLTKRPRPAVGASGNIGGNANDGNLELRLPRVVIFDQFEEIFTVHPERYKDRQDFFLQVSDALKADPFLRVVFSMREDYLAEVDPYSDILPQNLRTRFRLERLRKGNAVSAVKQPLAAARLQTSRKFADGAGETLVERLMLIKVKTASGEKIEVSGEFVDPVQLQVVCQTLWEKLPADKAVITREDIDKYANVDEALSDFYETSLRRAVTIANNAIRVTPEADVEETITITEGAVRGWFEQKLITREGKRNMVFREANTTAGLSNLVVDELENQHLIRVEMRGGEPWYELSHDRFILPIRESNRRFLMQQPLAQRKAQELEERADAWLKSHRSEKLLLNRAELLDAQNWMRTDAAAIGYSETLFSLIGASEAAIQHEDAQHQQKLADALSRQAVAEHQRARYFRVGLMVTSLLFMLTLGATGFAVKGWRKAQTAQAAAQSASDDNKRNYAEAMKQWHYAELQTRAAEEARTDLERLTESLKKANAQKETERKKAEEARGRAEGEKTVATKAANDAEIAKKSAQANLGRATDSFDKLTASVWADKAMKASENDPEMALGIALLAFNKAENESTEYSLRQAYLRLKGHVTLRGHNDIVRNAIYSPDGRFIFTASEDATVKMWDANTKQEIRTFAGHRRGIHALAISSDGSLIATEAADSTGRIWKVSDRSFFELTDLSGPVAALAFSPNGRLVATEATSEKEKAGATPRLWDTSTRKIFHTLIGHTDAVSAVAFSPDGKYLVTASWDRTARVWEVGTGQQLKVLEGHTAPLTSVAFSPDGKVIVTGSYDGTARTWDAASGNLLMTLKGHTGAVQTVAFNAQGNMILTSGKKVRSTADVSLKKIPLPKELPADDTAPEDNTVRLYGINGDPLGVFSQEDEINSAAFGADGRIVITASKDGTARAWDVETGKSIGQFRPPQELEEQDEDKSKNSAVLSPDNHYLLTSASDNTAEVWRIDSVWPLPQFVLVSAIQDVRFAGNDLIVSSTTSGTRYWNLGTRYWIPGGVEFTSKDFTQPVQSATISVDEKSVVTLNKGGTAQVRDLASKKVVDLQKPTNPLRRVMYSPRQTYIAGTSGDSAYIWEAATGRLIRTFSQDGAATVAKRGVRTLLISDMAFSIDERYFAIARKDGKVETYDMTTGALIKIFQAHDDVINSIRFDSETETPFIVTSSSDRTARVCRFDGLKCFPSLRGHIAAVSFADFSRDGKFIVTVGRDGRVRVWQMNISSASLVTEMRANLQQFTIAKFNADGTKIVAGTQSRSVFTFECEVCRPIEQVKALALGLMPKQPQEQELVDRQICPSKEEREKIWGIQLKRWDCEETSLASLNGLPR
jgi:WD40 repeat protein